MQGRTVTLIPPSLRLGLGSFPLSGDTSRFSTKRRVAAYARVSTDKEEQEHSHAQQVDYYTRKINENNDWQLVEVYTDEGISATSTKRRDGFNRMIQDALDGKIDYILTKSISRFARNTVDSLQTIRKLKEQSVYVYFEKESIDTSDAKGELLITIMSSLAQEESRSISENVTWGQRKRMQDGKVTMPYKNFLGYEKGAEGKPVVVESEAETVRYIYKRYLRGQTATNIANNLTEQGILTPRGKQKWASSTVISILQSEKYASNARLQKGFTVDFLTKTRKVNEGELPSYWVENSHPAIVSVEVFDLVQSEIARRKEIGAVRSCAHALSGMAFCGCCGSVFGSKTQHSGREYSRIIWRCNRKYAVKGQVLCSNSHLTTEQLEQAFVEAFNQMLEVKDDYLIEYDVIVEMLTNTNKLDVEAANLQAEAMGIYDKIQAGIVKNSRIVLDQKAYSEEEQELQDRYTAVKARLDEIAAEKKERGIRKEKLNMFLTELAEQEGLITEFDAELFHATVDRVTVKSEHEVVVKFREETEIAVEVNKTL